MANILGNSHPHLYVPRKIRLGVETRVRQNVIRVQWSCAPSPLWWLQPPTPATSSHCVVKGSRSYASYTELEACGSFLFSAVQWSVLTRMTFPVLEKKPPERDTSATSKKSRISFNVRAPLFNFPLPTIVAHTHGCDGFWPLLSPVKPDFVCCSRCKKMEASFRCGNC